MTYTMTTAEIQAQLDAWEAEFRTAWERLQASGLGDRISTGWGGSLQIAERGYGWVDEALVLSGTATPRSYLLTEDGRGADTTRWHDGPGTGDSVYVERWECGLRTFHGYVDPGSRRVVQTG
jgi:hypothetical protein